MRETTIARNNQSDVVGSLLETGTTYVRPYRVDEQWYNFKPDELADYRVGRHHVGFWLEWDCGTVNVRDLVPCSATIVTSGWPCCALGCLALSVQTCDSSVHARGFASSLYC